MSADAMPDRYRPDPTRRMTVTNDRRRETNPARLKVSSIVLRDWIGLTDTPVTLRYAPKDEATVKLGVHLPPLLGEAVVSRRERGSGYEYRANVPTPVLSYLNADPGDTAEYERHTDGTVTVRLVDGEP